jgi:vacuolar iron transporter family protein
MPKGSPAHEWSAADIREVQHNYLDERSSRWMYLGLAEVDRVPERAKILRGLAQYEERHAALWAKLLKEIGKGVPRDRRFFQHRLLVGMARLVGVGLVLPIVHREEVDGIANYRDQARRWQDPRAQEVFDALMPDEVAHEIETSKEAQEAGGKGASSLRSLLLGSIDGFASTVALTAGVAGATNSDAAVLIAGSAAVVAGALSMAASEYVSVKAETEAQAGEIRMEKEAFSVAPGSKELQLEAAYRDKGLTTEEAHTVVARLRNTPSRFLEVLERERYGPSQGEAERPGRQGIMTGISFALAGAVPVAPFLLLPPHLAVVVSVLVTAFALFLAGIFRALSSLNPFLRSGTEMLAVGMLAAAGTYVIGYFIGGAVG